MTQRPEPKATRHARPPIPLETALGVLLELLQPLSTETVPLHAAHARILAESLTAAADQPAFNRAMMDGFAVRSHDCAEAGAILQAIGEAPAGSPLNLHVGAGRCARVMTGGVVPPGADAVIAVEDTESVTGSAVELVGSTWRMHVAAAKGKHVAQTGSEVVKGAVVVAAGSRLSAGRVGTLAHFGHATVRVHRQPRVAVMPTGTEIVPIDATPLPGQVRNSNSVVVAGLVRAFGGLPTVYPPVIDERDKHVAAMKGALLESDILVTSGGVSMGDYDLVAAALRDLGAEIHFHRVAIKPGKPVLCATWENRLILGLPGNPVSGYVCASLFLRAAIAAMSGATRRQWQTIAVPLAHDLRATKGRAEISPARLVQRDGATQVVVVNTAGSADLAHFSLHDVLTLRQPHDGPRKAGESVDVLVWPEAS